MSKDLCLHFKIQAIDMCRAMKEFTKIFMFSIGDVEAGVSFTCIDYNSNDGIAIESYSN